MAANALPPHWYHRRRMAVRQRYPAIKHLQLDGSFLLIFPMINPKLIYETDPRLNGKISNKETSIVDHESGKFSRSQFLPPHSHIANSIIQNYANFPLFQRLRAEREVEEVKWRVSISLPLWTLISKEAQRRLASFDTRQIYLYSSRALRAKASRPAPRVCLCCERGTWKRPLPSNSETSNKNI